MRSLSFIISALICLSATSCLARPYHALREATVYVDARSDWINTRIRVSKGQTVVFRCEGAWAVAPLNERERWPDAGPEGHGNHPGEIVHRAGDAKKELPGTPFGALLGKVDSKVFPIGSREKVVMPADGVLYLVINDYPFYRHDNRGGLTVYISKE
ncbi:MAG: hypothetical protein QM278_12090 [Pseudomonadota bacterium]|nr:hypothetical protein [Pseudomonadota bacterium]